jgi:hypothetical protein
MMSELSGAAARFSLMKADTAIALIPAGTSLWLSLSTLRSRRLGTICATVSAVIGLATTSEDVFGWDLGIDRPRVRPRATGAPLPGRLGLKHHHAEARL